MRRAVIVVSLLAVLGGYGGVAGRMAQAEAPTTVLVGQATLEDIYKKLDDIAQQRQGGGGGKDLEGQVARILKNQEAILADLQIIKIRSLHR